ncbi:MAG: hypothetical protein SCL54_08290 [Bacillota bacterium]|nr:hypothetical protein [Bacillota bacterium]
MSIFEWILVGAVLLVFVIILFYAAVDLFRDRKYYIAKKKNVTAITEHKNKKRR